MEPAEQEREPVLCVDLDGTLVRTDTLVETFLIYIRRYPSRLFRLPWILLTKGLAVMKRRIAESVELPADTLPYQTLFLEWLREQKEQGRKLVLVTAADRIIADRIAAFIGLFDEVLATDGTVNLKGAYKARTLKERFGRFAYAGNDWPDLAVWKEAAEVIVVEPSPFLLRFLPRRPDRVFCRRSTLFADLARQLRLFQWAKNGLVFVAPLLAHRLEDPAVWLNGAGAFFAFGLSASAVYQLNDLFDLEADRRHLRKRNRPLASGRVSIRAMICFFPFPALAGLLLSWVIDPFLCAVTALYLLMNLAYSLKLKSVPVVDVLLLSFFYPLRIIAGAVAAGVPCSAWFIEFTALLFLSLATVKRYAEVRDAAAESRVDVPRRGYRPAHLRMLARFGTGFALLAGLVFGVYILHANSAEQLYSKPDLLWGVWVLFALWIGRIWKLAFSGALHDDPVEFALTDRFTWLIGIVALIFVVSAALL